jgi:hypothetical protein
VSLKRANLLFWTGLLLYVASFFLVAVEKTGEGRRELRGYICAFDSLVWSSGGVLEIWHRSAHVGSTSEFLDFLSLLISAWVNPIFLLSATFLHFKRANFAIRTTVFVAVLTMIPWCWVFFHFERLSPREGHYVWILGMLLVLVSRFSVHRDSDFQPVRA